MVDWTVPRAAVIPTHNRPAELQRCVEAISPQVDLLVVIDNASEPRADPRPVGPLLHLMGDPEQPPNLSRLWNRGLEFVQQFMHRFDLLDETGRWDVAVLNDDAVPPPSWFDAVAGAMRREGADAASSYPFDDLTPDYVCVHRNGPPSIATRLAGWAFILRGEWNGARIDESMRWMFSDDDVSYRAKLAGGLVHVGGFPVPNTGADTSTRGVLAEQGGRDRAAFVEKHGVQPW